MVGMVGVEDEFFVLVPVIAHVKRVILCGQGRINGVFEIERRVLAVRCPFPAPDILESLAHGDYFKR